jgi:hypothetical protein
VRELFLTDGATTVELLEPLVMGSPLEAFLNRNPSGRLLHLATDLDAAGNRAGAAPGRRQQNYPRPLQIALQRYR